VRLSVTFVLIQIVCDYNFLGPDPISGFVFMFFLSCFLRSVSTASWSNQKQMNQTGNIYKINGEKQKGGKMEKKWEEKNLWKHEGNQRARGTSGLPSAPHAPPFIVFPGAEKDNFQIKIEQYWQNLHNKLPNIKLSINLKKSPLKCFSERYAILDCVAGGVVFNLSRRLSICCGVSLSVAVSFYLLRCLSICCGIAPSVVVSLYLLWCFSICCGVFQSVADTS